MKIEHYDISTCMGKITGSAPLFLSEAHVQELNIIGYTGKNSYGIKTSWQSYLNTINKGNFSVTPTKTDNGDFSESFAVIRVLI